MEFDLRSNALWVSPGVQGLPGGQHQLGFEDLDKSLVFLQGLRRQYLHNLIRVFQHHLMTLTHPGFLPEERGLGCLQSKLNGLPAACEQ